MTLFIIHTKTKVAINMHNLAVSKVSGNPYCESNGNARIETYAANLIVM